jgi:hypothetical protein
MCGAANMSGSTPKSVFSSGTTTANS